MLMEEHKDSLQRQEEAEEYSFLQEMIKDEAGSPKKARKDVLRMLGLGVVCGVTACFTFLVLEPWAGSYFKSDPEQVRIPEEENAGEGEAADAAEVEVTVSEEVLEELARQQMQEDSETDSYRQMLQSLHVTAQNSNESVVEISGGDSEPWSISGVVVADNGQELLILGRTSPVSDVKGIQVSFANGEKHEAVIKRQDRNCELCIYAVARDTIAGETWKEIRIASLGSSEAAAVGDTVIVLGKTFGTDSVISYGLVDAEKDYLGIADGQYERIHTNVAGSDAGSGIVVNRDGEVIGIVHPAAVEEEEGNKISGYGISDIKKIIELLSNGEGVPYTGMCGVDVTEDMQAQGFPAGVSVKAVEADSPAMAAGIQSGDIITGIDGEEVASFEEYHRLLMEKAVGSELQITACRQGTGGEYVDIDFTVKTGTKE